MFGKAKKTGQTENLNTSGVGEKHVAAQQTQLPLDDTMTRLIAQELPVLDSADRVEVYRLLKEYDGPVITAQEQLPARIREIMDL